MYRSYEQDKTKLNTFFFLNDYFIQVSKKQKNTQGFVFIYHQIFNKFCISWIFFHTELLFISISNKVILKFCLWAKDTEDFKKACDKIGN